MANAKRSRNDDDDDDDDDVTANEVKYTQSHKKLYDLLKRKIKEHWGAALGKIPKSKENSKRKQKRKTRTTKGTQDNSDSSIDSEDQNLFGTTHDPYFLDIERSIDDPEVIYVLNKYVDYFMLEYNGCKKYGISFSHEFFIIIFA